MVLLPDFAGAVDRACAGEGEVGEAVGVQEGGGASAFEAAGEFGECGVVVDVGGAFEDGVLFDEDVDALLEEEGSGEEGAFGDD